MHYHFFLALIFLFLLCPKIGYTDTVNNKNVNEPQKSELNKQISLLNNELKETEKELEKIKVFLKKSSDTSIKENIDKYKKDLFSLRGKIRKRIENIDQNLQRSIKRKIKNDINILKLNLSELIDDTVNNYNEINKKSSDFLLSQSTLDQQIITIKNDLEKINVLLNNLSDVYNKIISEKSKQPKENVEKNIEKNVEIYILAASISAILLLSIAALFLYIKTLHKKSNDALSIKANEINALSTKMNEIDGKIIEPLINFTDKLEKDNLFAQKADISEQHELVKKIADRLTFMEVTMLKMDPSVRGFKQLSKSISQIKNNILANGYEIVEMLGKPYNPGMKLIANFIDDENIPKGQQIITSVTKPQINYRGIMIQSAQITVSKND